jgi:hypothetical protein
LNRSSRGAIKLHNTPAISAIPTMKRNVDTEQFRAADEMRAHEIASSM